MLPEENMRENLFSAEPVSPERQQRFREEIARIVEPRLPRSHRWYYIIALVGSVAGLPGAVCGLLFDREHRWTWALYVLAFSAFAGWIGYILRRGAEPFRSMQAMSKAFVGISIGVTGFLIFHGLQNPSLVGVFWALGGLLISVLTSFINLWNRVIASERTMREHVLRVEYRIADLASRLPQKKE